MIEQPDDGVLTGFRPDQLEGFRIAVTSDRRSEDLIAAFERRGAEVTHAPAIRVTAVDDDTTVARDTAAIIEAKPDILLATTSYGVRRWFEVADAGGVGPQLSGVLTGSRILVRGPKARGAIRAAGLDDAGMSDQETTESLVDQVLRDGAAGLTIAVQLHGFTDHAQLERLETAGARVLTVAPYRWSVPEDSSRVIKLVDAICAGSIDAVTFTSAPAAVSVLSTAEGIGRLDDLVEALRTSVLTAAVGHVTAAPLFGAGAQPIIPSRYRMGALIRMVCERLENEHVMRSETVRGTLELRGRLVAVDGDKSLLAPVPLTLFRTLLAARGSVVSRADLSRALPEVEDDHAVDAAMSRLRQSLPVPDLVSTVIKRGYRLNVG